MYAAVGRTEVNDVFHRPSTAPEAGQVVAKSGYRAVQAGRLVVMATVVLESSC